MTTLFVSPNGSDHAVLKTIFMRSNWNLRSAFSCADAIELLRSEPIPVVICDGDLPDGSWQKLVENTGHMPARPRVIVSVRNPDEHLWNDVLRDGGYDLLAMPWAAREVLKTISLAWRSWDFARRSAKVRVTSAAS